MQFFVEDLKQENYHDVRLYQVITVNFPRTFYIHVILPQHMYLFYLPDEVVFYRYETSPTLLSLPKHQCKLITASFELVGEGELQNSQSGLDTLCVPGE